jgi:hypothetical protein
MKNFLFLAFAASAVFLPLSLLHGQIQDQALDFASPPAWGHGTCQTVWGAGPSTVKFRGDEGMSESGGDRFAVIDAGLWTPAGDIPYVRSIVSQTVWPLGQVTAEDAGKTVKFDALFGWYGGEPMRVKDLTVSASAGFLFGTDSVGPLEGGQEFQFESVSEREWGSVSATYTFKPEDEGKELSVMVTVLSKQEIAQGLPVIATSDWKVTVSD